MSRTTYADLAAELQSIAERLAKLDEQGVLAPDHSQFYVSFGYCRTAEESKKDAEAVDAIAAALGLTPVTEVTGRGARREAQRVARSGRESGLHVNVRATLPAPKTRAQTLDELRRENDELREKLAQGGDQ